jgi:hypothetical protein
MSGLALGAIPGGFAAPVLREGFNRLTFESQLTPRITVEDPFAPRPPSSLVGQFVKPKITLSGKLGTQVISPWGNPQPWVFPVVVTAVVLVLVGTGYAIGRRS